MRGRSCQQLSSCKGSLEEERRESYRAKALIAQEKRAKDTALPAVKKLPSERGPSELLRQ